MDALRLAEDNEDKDNISNGIVYTPDLLRQILLAYTDDFGYILPANKARIHLNFRERTAWTFGTHFRLVWCSITKLQVDLKFKNDWTYDQIDKHNSDPSTPGLNLFALLFQVCFVVCVRFVLCKYFNASHLNHHCYSRGWLTRRPNMFQANAVLRRCSGGRT